MKAVGIICEYNPFHNGHKHQLEQAKALSGCDTAVCIMSGSAVQRGEVACFDKWSRVRSALENGADLVIELPAWYVLQSAQAFARGGIELLHATGMISALSFGSEAADKAALLRCAEVLCEEDAGLKGCIDSAMKGGASYPSALKHAMDELYPAESACLENPNDMLGVSYITAMLRLGADFEIHPVKRNVSHHSHLPQGAFASSTAIRSALARGEDISALVPSVIEGARYDMKNLESFIIGFYRTASPHKLKAIPGIESGFENKLIATSATATCLEDFYGSMVSRRYTLSRVKRTVLAGVLGMEQGKKADYLRVLGMTERGAEFIKEAKNKARLPFVVKTADFTPAADSTFPYDIAATDIAALACEDTSQRSAGADYYNPPVMVRL